jgi:predicted phosphodiesterase
VSFQIPMASCGPGWRRPSVEAHHGVLYLNPGSAGPRRFSLPASVCLLRVEGEGLDVKLTELDV